MKTVYIINHEGRIEPVSYAELVWQFVDTTTTPGGIAPRLHIREEIWFKAGDALFEKREDAGDSFEEVTRFEGWAWNPRGFAKRWQVFDTEEEAEKWLFKGAEVDFKNDCDAPTIFDTREEAEKWLSNNT